MLMNADTSQLLIIDVQAQLLPAMATPDEVVRRCNILLEAARTIDVPVTVSEQYPKGLGHTDEGIKLANSDRVMEKTAFSCLRDEAIAAHLLDLREDGRHQVVVGGMESHVCVMQTCLDLVDAGFEVFLAADAVSSRAPSSVELATARLRDEGVSIVNTEMAVFEWLKVAGTPAFKALSALIK